MVPSRTWRRCRPTPRSRRSTSRHRPICCVACRVGPVASVLRRPGACAKAAAVYAGRRMEGRVPPIFGTHPRCRVPSRPPACPPSGRACVLSAIDLPSRADVGPRIPSPSHAQAAAFYAVVITCSPLCSKSELRRALKRCRLIDEHLHRSQVRRRGRHDVAQLQDPAQSAYIAPEHGDRLRYFVAWLGQIQHHLERSAGVGHAVQASDSAFAIGARCFRSCGHVARMIRTLPR